MAESLLTPPASTSNAAPEGTSAPAGNAPAGGVVNPPAAQTPNAAPKAEANANTPPATPAAKAPDYSTLKLPDSGEFDGDVRTAFEGVARKHNLSSDAAQELLNEVTPKLAARRAAQLDEQIKATRESWHAASTSHKEWGGDKLQASLATASKALAIAGPELPAFLKETGLDMHPAVIGWAVAVGKALSPDRVVSPGAGGPGARKSDAEVIFGSVDKK